MSDKNFSPEAGANMEERLWDYIDGLSSASEKIFIEELIATQQEWRQKYHQLLDAHQLLTNNLELEEPSMRFGQNVMEEIARYHIAPATKSYINKKIIYGIGGFFIVMILGLLIYSFGQINLSQESNSTVSQYANKIDWGKFFNNTYTNIFMMINVVLGLMLLDMYITKKKKSFTEKHS